SGKELHGLIRRLWLNNNCSRHHHQQWRRALLLILNIIIFLLQFIWVCVIYICSRERRKWGRPKGRQSDIFKRWKLRMKPGDFCRGTE
ncbi:hypothetical protein LINGRAHAP2_LOCUS3576, partial [Linum grandiflorum]